MSTTEAIARRSYGTGSLDTRSDKNGRETWVGRWYVPGADGKPRRIKKVIGPKRHPGERDGLTRPQAEKALRDLMAQHKPAVTGMARVRTISELSAGYLEDKRENGGRRGELAARSITAIDCARTNWIDPVLGSKAIGNVTVHDVDDLIRAMKRGGTEPSAKKPGPLAAKSIRNYIGTLSAMFKWASEPKRQAEWGLASNPCVGANLPGRAGTKAAGEMSFLTTDEVWSLADAAEACPYLHVDRALYLTAAMTGLRYGELLALRWLDVDWAGSSVHVRRSYDYVNTAFKAPKSGKVRSVPLTPDLATELDALSKASRWNRDGDLVFGDPRDGLPLRRTPTLRRYEKALTTALLDPRFKFHNLRHTFGTTLARDGVAMRDIQEYMGHADLSTTQIYSHFAPRAEAAARIGAAFARGPVRGPVLSEYPPALAT